MEPKFAHQSFGRKLKTMLKVDFRRMFTQPLFYIMIGIAAVVPVLVLIMTTMMDGSVSVDPTTGVETVIHGFDNAWQSIATLSTQPSAGMDMVSMCNINLLYFAVPVFVCLFVGEDFRSGYAKHLFTVHAKRLCDLQDALRLCLRRGNDPGLAVGHPSGRCHCRTAL